MNAQQLLSFQAATGHTAGTVSLLIASILMVLIFIWAAWIVRQSLSSLQRSEAAMTDLLFAGLRVAALIWIGMYIAGL
ncbi:MAG: DUF3262 family protein [Candidatus Sedimenticola endophacoides]